MVRLTIGIIVLSLVLGGVAAGPASAQVNDDNGAEVCADAPRDGDSLVVALPDGTYVYGDESVTLLPGTEADIALCSGGEDNNVVPTSAWPGPNNNDIDGVNVISQNEYNYSIRVTDVPEDPDISFGSAIEQRNEVNAPEVAVTPGRIASISIDGERFTIVVNSDTRRNLTDASGSYETTLNEMQTAAGNINSSAKNGSIEGLNESLSGVNKTRALNDDYAQIQSILFTANATGALNASEEQHTKSLKEVQENLTATNGKLNDRTGNTAGKVLDDLLAVLLAGAVLGGVGGWYGTNRVLSDVENKRRRSSAVDFRPKHLAGQAAVAVLLVGGAVALAVVLGLLNPIIVAIGAVIPL
jgi:cell division protein ZapA (FtsZ GTPase activity inhibitor)